MIWDNLPAHHSRLMGAWLQGQCHWLQIEYLPGYAHDLDPVALAIAAQNATANAVALTLEGTPLLHGPCPAGTQCILVGDLFYERAAATGLEAWLHTAHRRGVQVLIADASRPFVPTIGVRCLWEARLATAWDVEGTPERTVRLLTLEA